MSDQAERASRFRALHDDERPLLLPNPWDLGSAKLFASMGFEALATTSAGFAMTVGRLDGSVSRDEAIAHATSIAAATELPVSADLEDCFAEDPAGVAETLRLAAGAGLAGASIEDYTRNPDDPVYEIERAAERVAAAAEAAHAGDARLVLTARAENHLYEAGDLADTIARLQTYQEAGADALYAPGLHDLDEIRELVSAVDLPVNVLAWPGGPSVSELASVGVKRVSVGSAFAYASLAGAAEAARELIDEGTYGFWEQAGAGAKAARSAFGA